MTETLEKLPWRTKLFLCHVGHCAEESMIFYFDSKNSTPDQDVKVMINRRGGYFINKFEDDPHTIVICNNNEDLDNEISTRDRSYDRFDVKFVTDSFQAQKLKDLNNYRIGPSLFFSYDANEILHRKRKWSDLKRKPESPNPTRRPDYKGTPCQSPMIDSGKRSSKLADESNNAKILAKPTVENRNITLEPIEKSSHAVKSSISGSNLKSKELFTADEIGQALDCTESESEAFESSEDEYGQPCHSKSIVDKKDKKRQKDRSNGENEKEKSSVLLVKDTKKNNSSKQAVKRSPRLDVNPNCNERGKSSKSPLKPLEKEVKSKPREESHHSPTKKGLRSSKLTSKGAINYPRTSTPLKLSERTNSGRKRIFEKRDSSTPEPMPLPSIKDYRWEPMPATKTKSNQRKPQTESPISIPNHSSDSEGYDSDNTAVIPKRFLRSSRVTPLSTSVIDNQKPTCSKYCQINEKDHAFKSSAKGTWNRNSSMRVIESDDSSTEISEEDNRESDFLQKSKETVVQRSKTKPMEKSIQSAEEDRQNEKSFETTRRNTIKKTGPTKPTALSKTARRVRLMVRGNASPSPEPTPQRQKTRPESPLGSPVSDLDFDSDSDVSCKTTSSKTVFRREYTESDRIKIIDFIVDNSFYRYVRGNKIWMQLELENTLPNRTYQSLKEHYRKKIGPNIKRFKLDSAVIKQFEEAQKYLRHNKRVAEAPIDIDTKMFLKKK